MTAHPLPRLVRRSRSALVLAALISTFVALWEMPPLASTAPAQPPAIYA